MTVFLHTVIFCEPFCRIADFGKAVKQQEKKLTFSP